MTESDPPPTPTPKWPLLAAFFIAIVDIALLPAFFKLDNPVSPWLFALGIQCLAGIALIAKGGDGRPWGIALIFGVVYMVVLVVALGLLAFVVCLGLLTGGFNK